MGAVEEVGKAGNTFIAAMATQPLALALVACNVILLMLFFFVSNNRAKEFAVIMETNKEVNQLLYNCVPAGKENGALTLPFFAATPPIPLGTVLLASLTEVRNHGAHDLLHHSPRSRSHRIGDRS